MRRVSFGPARGDVIFLAMLLGVTLAGLFFELAYLTRLFWFG